MTTTATPGTRAGTVLRHTMKKERPALVARTAPRRNVAGHDLGTVDLEPTVFGLTPNRAVLHQVVTAQLAGIRAGTQSTRTRAEVRGGGAKPFRQKGTGRARQGSSRSPSMSGGGVALGPKPRSYAQQTPKKMVRLALLSALSDRAEIGRIVVVDDWQITAPRTKDAAAMVHKLKLGTDSVLIVVAQDEIDLALSVRNLPRVRTTTFAELAAHDVLRADWLALLGPHRADVRGRLLRHPRDGTRCRPRRSSGRCERGGCGRRRRRRGRGRSRGRGRERGHRPGHHGGEDHQDGQGGQGHEGDEVRLEVRRDRGDTGHQGGEVDEGGDDQGGQGHEGHEGHQARGLHRGRQRRGRQRGDRRCVTPCPC